MPVGVKAGFKVAFASHTHRLGSNFSHGLIISQLTRKTKDTTLARLIIDQMMTALCDLDLNPKHFSNSHPVRLLVSSFEDTAPATSYKLNSRVDQVGLLWILQDNSFGTANATTATVIWPIGHLTLFATIIHQST